MEQKQEVNTQLIAKTNYVDALLVSFVENTASSYKIPVKETFQLRTNALYEIEKQKSIEELRGEMNCTLQ